MTDADRERDRNGDAPEYDDRDDRDDHHGHGGGDETTDQHGHGETTDPHGHHDDRSVGVAVLTVSSSRSLDDDPAGDAAADLLADAGNEVVTRELVPDDLDRVQETVHTLVKRDDTAAVVTTGGTGVTPDDVTPEAIGPLLDKELPGFGEVFRTLSREEVGTRVVATRALGGVADGTLVFSLPGSENAVRLGVADVVLPELGHLAGLARGE